MRTLTEPALSELREKLERALEVKLHELERTFNLLHASVEDIRTRLIKDDPVRVWFIGPGTLQGLGARVDLLCGEVITLQDSLKNVADQQDRQTTVEDVKTAG
ncbi:MAG: hypothetical protein ACYC9Q_09155 [Bacillota bacterium]